MTAPTIQSDRQAFLQEIDRVHPSLAEETLDFLFAPDCENQNLDSLDLNSTRLGVAKGAFQVPDSIEEHNEEVDRMLPGQA